MKLLTHYSNEMKKEEKTKMKRVLSMITILAIVLALPACGGGGKQQDNRTKSSVDELVANYGYQWTDTSAPILNETGAKELSFNIYSSKNASALD